jgi:hypothetical protein
VSRRESTSEKWASGVVGSRPEFFLSKIRKSIKEETRLKNRKTAGFELDLSKRGKQASKIEKALCLDLI